MDDTPYPVGVVVHDAATGRVGVVMCHDGALYYLRPRSGGLEWTARREDLSAIISDILRPTVAELNANSRKGF
ncbi:hypothetical protein ACH41E_00075 [Streptomyces sp. NPDC020412]|uniref:hypothetical protein n=1 Tax=Streptomyces sp. NPDC020412 TaxID=3365073 RepID=UPI00378A4E54